MARQDNTNDGDLPRRITQEVEHLQEQGVYRASSIVKALGYDAGTIAKLLRAAGREDMTRRFDGEVRRQEKEKARIARIREANQGVAEDVEFLLEQGEHPTAIASRMGRTVGALDILLRRAGHKHLATPFQRELARVRTQTKREARERRELDEAHSADDEVFIQTVEELLADHVRPTTIAERLGVTLTQVEYRTRRHGHVEIARVFRRERDRQRREDDRARHRRSYYAQESRAS